jgi:hypothetical protein
VIITRDQSGTSTALHDRGGNDLSGRPGRLAFAGAEAVNIEGVVSIGEGFVRLDSPAGSITVSDGWRRASSRYSAADTDRLLIELGANRQDGRIELNLTGDVLFDFDASTMRADAATELAKLAHVLRRQATSWSSAIPTRSAKTATTRRCWCRRAIRLPVRPSSAAGRVVEWVRVC